MRRTHIIELEAISGYAWEHIADMLYLEAKQWEGDPQTQTELMNTSNMIRNSLEKVDPFQPDKMPKEEEDWI